MGPSSETVGPLPQNNGSQISNKIWDHITSFSHHITSFSPSFAIIFSSFVIGGRCHGVTRMKIENINVGGGAGVENRNVGLFGVEN